MNTGTGSHPNRCARCGSPLSSQARGNCPACLLRQLIGPSDGTVAPFPTPSGYTLLAEIGRGGSGVVWKARQHGLEREVALKVLAAGMLASEAERARLRREAEAMARLSHPHIVAIHEVGEVEGYLFLAMEFLSGGTLASRLLAGPLEPNTAAVILQESADALSHAHERGVIHRDLKPANILLDQMGAPHLADFGLAKLVPAAPLVAGQQPTPFELTLSGHALGTVHYLAPEQAGASARNVGPAVDVHALGAVLYHCLTGRPPFLGNSFAETLRQVIEEEPPPVRSLNPAVPRDLETICFKCLRKEPGHRYVTAAELRDDLNRFLKGLPVVARPVSSVERAAKMARRHPIGTSLVLALVLALIGWFLSVQLQLTRLERANRQLKERDALHSSELTEMELAKGETVRALSRLARAVRDNPEAQFLSQRLAALMNQRTWLLPERELGLDTKGAEAVAFHPDGNTVAVVIRRERKIFVQLFRLTSGERIRDPWDPGVDAIAALEFSSDGRALHLQPRKGPIQTLPLNGAETASNRADSIGDRLLSRDSSFQLVATNQHKPWAATLLIASNHPEKPIVTVAGEEPLPGDPWSPKGSPPRFATSCRGGVRIRDGQTGELLAEAPDVGGIVQGASWSPDGRMLLLATYNLPVRLWKLVEPPPTIPVHSVTGLIRSLHWSRDGRRVVATTDGDGLLVVDPGKNGSEIILKHWTRAAFARRSSELFLGGRGGQLARVPAEGVTPIPLPYQATGTPDRLDVTEDDRWLAVATTDQSLSIIDRATGQLSAGPVSVHPPGSKGSGMKRVFGLAFSPTGDSVAVASAQHIAGLWTVPDLQPRFTWRTNAPFTSVAFSPNGRWVALGSMLGSAWLVDAKTGVIERLLPHTGEVFHVAFSPDGNRLISTDAQGQIRVWQIPDGRLELDVMAGFFQSQWAGFDPTTDSFAAITFDGRVTWWSAHNGQPLADSIHVGLSEQLTRAAFQPQGSLLAVGGRDGFALIESPVSSSAVPDWIVDLAEAIAGTRILKDGSMENLPPEHLIDLRHRIGRDAHLSPLWERAAKRFALP